MKYTIVNVLLICTLCSGCSHLGGAKHGERVEVPTELNSQIYDYFAKKERMAVSEIKLFRCTLIDWGELHLTDRVLYTANVVLQNKGDAVPEFRKVFVLEPDPAKPTDGKWELIALVDHNFGQPPCQNQFPKS